MSNRTSSDSELVRSLRRASQRFPDLDDEIVSFNNEEIDRINSTENLMIDDEKTDDDPGILLFVVLLIRKFPEDLL